MGRATWVQQMKTNGSGAEHAAQSSTRRGSARFEGRVLVIDDSPTARAHIVGLLERAGSVVHELPSAIGATRTVVRNQIDTVVVDISMPGLSGDKLVTVLRENPKLGQLTIIVVSGLSDLELEGVRGSVPADAVLSKAHLETSLIATLHRVRLSRHATRV
jgi:CheY-like chemotaxis protein